MRCLTFIGGNPLEVAAMYNKWAKDKSLAKDVIIHSHIVPPSEGEFAGTLAILVFFDEQLHPSWVGATGAKVQVGTITVEP